ncbi:GNAT family N-acetyltransferase [Nisaea sediminum]|uniref:GNAT family N-acetyltransferase n=1 Tax=Nisaea sediminum TaxID=2775867 RepID=UPI0018687F67|nr:GNAT family N-acetyltransferase [Nisaea sediminum]
MKLESVTRPAVVADAEGISNVIAVTSRESNAADYAPETIETVVSSSSPGRIEALIREGDFFVVEHGGRIVAAAGLVDETVRRLFVLPEYQGAGIGRELLAALEGATLRRGIQVLHVNSSLTAVGFYRKAGFADGAEESLDGIRFVRMSKRLAGG